MPTNSSLFQLGNFTLHSGEHSNFKIECDSLTDEEWEALAHMAAERLPFLFSDVIPIPRGGAKLSCALQQYRDPNAALTLIVDDVLTTGSSIKDKMKQINGATRGIVAFARSEPPPNVYSIFRLTL